MNELLDKMVGQAVKDVWSNPQEDRRITFKATVFSKRSGAKGYVELPWDTFTLPNQDKYYLVLQLGQLTSTSYGVDTVIANWTKLADVIADNDMFLQIHTNSRMLHLGDSYMKRMSDRSVLFAIDLSQNEELIGLGKDIYIRFYSNAWLNTEEGNQNPGVDTKSYYVESISVASQFITAYKNVKLLSGNTFLYHNGYYVSDIHILDVVIGDRLEYITDRTGLSYFDSDLSNLKAFDSTIDSRRKYILLQPDDNGNFLMPAGDIEIYVCQDVVNGNGDVVSKGVYYSNLKESDVRALTHRDWSLDAGKVQNTISSQEMVFGNPYLRVFIRQATWAENVILDGNQVKDLYLLDLEKRSMLMSTAASPVTEWKAENLEHCPYVRWMELANTNLSIDNLKNVYSYHGLNYMAEKATVNNNVVKLPLIMSKGGLVFEYDNTGVLSNVRRVESASDVSVSDGVSYVDCYPGAAVSTGSGLESASSHDDDPVDGFAQELFYRNQAGSWVIAEEGSDYIMDVVNGVVNWNDKHLGNVKGKRHSNRYYYNEFTLLSRDVGLKLPIFGINGEPSSGLEMGRLQIWVNNRKLIRGLEYVVEYPFYRILAREHYEEDLVNVKLLFSGLSIDNVKPRVGFIKHGVINHGGRFDISFNRFKEIVIGGRRADKSQVVFNERPDTGIMNGRFKNGLPYSLEYPINHVANDTIGLLTKTKREALALDAVIEDYLGQVDPEENASNVVYIDGKYALTSPFMATIIEDILNGKLEINYSDPSSGYVSRVCADYVYILNSDPVNNSSIEWDFIDLHPTGRVEPIEVTGAIYSFLAKANELYMNNRCNLNTYLLVNI